MKYLILPLMLITASVPAQELSTEVEQMQAIIDQQSERIAALEASTLPVEPTPPDPYPYTEPQLTSPRSIITNRESRLAKDIYLTEVPEPLSVTTKGMILPEGYKMVRVKHPPRVVCSEYPSDDTFTIQPIEKPVHIQPVPRVGEDNEASITIITSEE